MIDTKEILEQVKKQLVGVFDDRGKQKLLYEITNTNDIKVFDGNVMKNKDSLLKVN
jgi:hypothetical protein